MKTMDKNFLMKKIKEGIDFANSVIDYLELKEDERSVLSQVFVFTDVANNLIVSGAYRRSKIIQYEDIQKTINSIDSNIAVECLDMNYLCMNFDDLKLILNSDLIKTMQYIPDLFDCDDYSKLFSSLCNGMFLINTVGVAYGALLDESKNLLGYHSYNIAVAIQNDKIIPIVFEPQTGEYTIMNSNPQKLGNFYYKTLVTVFG